ncbi:MAG: CPBP family intramembrane glutamic endopeptidase [Bacteroidota bacterium]
MLTTLKDTWREVREYLPQPYDRLDEEATTGFKFGRLLSVLALDLAGAAVLMLLVSGITELGLLDLEEHAVAEAFSNMSTLGILALAVIAAPLFEELFFRLPLRFEANPFMGVARMVTPYRGTTQADGDVGERMDRRRANLRGWWDRHYRKIFYFSAILFAYVHLSNFELTTTVLLLSPILVAAQFWMGTLGGFLRARYGFVWTLLLHALHNLILVGGAVLGDGPTEKVAIENEEFRLKIEEVSPISRETDRSHVTNEDSLALVNYPLDDALSLLLEDDYSSIYYPPAAKAPKVNVYFRARQPLEAEKLLIVEELKKIYDFRVDPDGAQPGRATIVFEDL